MHDMATTQVQTRWADTRELDELAVHLTLARPGNPPRRCSRADVIRAAIDRLYQERRPLIEAELATWRGLLELAGSPIALLTLKLTGRGEPEPELVEEVSYGRSITPARWADYDITVALDGQPVDLPLRTELYDERSLTVEVFLTDEAGVVRIPIGGVSREASRGVGLYDVRLRSIADDLGLPTS